MAQLFIFGLGYSAGYIADTMRQSGWHVDATGSAGNVDFADPAAVAAALARASHVLSSVPPSAGSDPVLDAYGDKLPGKWLGYLSSTGVYGDTDGAWVDESAPTGTGRRSARAQADARWLDLGARVFRLPGIYGPSRSAFERIASGKAHRIAIPGQVFSRVHVADIASGVVAAMTGDAPAGAYNLSDDLPCSQNAVIEHACRLMGVEPPPLQSLEEADLSPMARGFYLENRRVANGRAKRVLGWKLQFPTYREGLAAIQAEVQAAISRSGAP
ncbi:SDR family oxidoreductase [Alteraurantiacibacter aestuarii]|uniref:SDR family NAD(P)-dependent oxidoreductase n=1 Tax=Alteraurantiacibacter aestuarii TaxID=650004 RepID=A0A844ZM56_9SPHN|nr:SDR family NAD(P)-dependent oxidoreductase [Alteraurantiacibacter aestuarii]MXO88683.1 SDR family NAD(P)-dependent oxidoreductase [Alteraurantiacibacter aestuarii]